jgi:iron complex outermembrane receptor protein
MRGSNPTNRIQKNCLKAVAGAVALSLSPFVSGTAMAQTNILEEITVTAQRREESLSEVPISISAIQGEDAHTWFESGEDVRALANRVPSLYVESSNGRLAPRFYMRGLGNTDFDLAASQSVSVIVDEVVQENVILKSFPIFDIERIEVLRGPQGTLFGRNTPAGIVKLDTRKPSEDLNGYAYASFGTYGTLNIEGALGGAFNQSGTLQGRLSVLSQNRNDWISNGYTGEEDALGGYNEMAWRGQLLWAPTDGFSGLVNVHGRKLDSGTASVFRANILSTGNNALNGNFVRDEVYFDEGDNNPQQADGLGGSLKLEFDFGNDMSLTSITAVESVDNSSLGDIDGGNADNGPGFIPFQSATLDGIDELSQTTQEFRFAHQATDALFWQAGIFYFNSDFSITTNPFFAAPTTIQHENTAYAVFGHVSYDFTDRFTLIAGLRYTDDDKDMTVTQGNFPVDPINVNDAKTSWDLSGHFTISDTVNLYARLANGFRAPTIQARDVAFFGPASTAKSETINSAEFGIKSTHLDDHIRLSAAVYVYKIDDMQLSAIGGVDNTVQLINAEEGNGSGFDMDAEFLVTDNLYVSLGVSYNNTEINDAALRIAPCGSGQCTVIDELDGDGNAIVNGNEFPQAPPTMINFALRYTKPVDTGNVFFHTDWARQGDTSFFLYDSNEYHTGSIYEGGVRLGYSHGDGNWEVALFGRNITDEENLKGGIDFNNNTGFVNEPRTWGATFKINFGE